MLPSAEFFAQVDSALKAQSFELISLRRELHAHPELSHQEFETTALLVATMESFGLQVHQREEGTGFYADLTPAGFDPATQPTVAIRTDIDALPINELNEVPYRSTRPGVMHACGHDVHMTVASAAAMALHDRVDQLPGRLRLVFQHAEEVSQGGAPEMVSFGAIDGVDAIIAAHCDPELSVGRIGLKTGPLTAAFDRFVIKIHGKGGHGARPHHCVDPIRVAAQVANALYQIVPQYFDSRDPVVLSIGSIHSGDSANVIPESARIEGTIRTLTRESRERMEPLLKKIATGICTSHEATCQIEVEHGAPSVDNHPQVIEVIKNAGRDLLGEEGVYQIPLPSMGGEDFSYYLEHIPGAMFRLGTAGPGPRTRHLLHSAKFDVDDRAITLGARVMTRAAISLMEKLAGGELKLKMARAKELELSGAE